jgi:hypothetical protein
MIILLMMAWAPAARAELRFAQPAADVGEVRGGSPLVHDFKFTNVGQEVVEVAEIQASCGCLKPRLEPRVFKPGEQGVLRVEVNTLSVAAGSHSWHIQVSYRSGETRHDASLVLTGKIISEVTVQPALLTVFADKGVTHDLLLTDLRPKPLHITAVQASSPKVQSRMVEEFHDGLGHLVRKIRLEVIADFPEGRHEETLDIFTDDPMYRDLRVPVTIVKRPRQRLTVQPREVSLTAPVGAAAPSRLVLLSDSDDGAIEIDRVTTADPALVCQWTRGPNNMATVRISVDRSRVQSEEFHGSVQIHVRKPVEQTLVIPVTVTLQTERPR